MTGKTHTLGGAMAGLAVAAVAGNTGAYLGITLLAGVAGGLFPDIDTTESKIGYKLRPLAIAVSKSTRHRGFCHTVPFILLMGALLAVLVLACGFIGLPFFECFIYHQGALTSTVAAFALGMLSHLFLDSLNPGGIMWLYPWKKRKYSWARIKTGSLGDFGILILLLLLFSIGLYLLLGTG